VAVVLAVLAAMPMDQVAVLAVLEHLTL